MLSTKKIMFVLPSLASGGAERVSINLMNSLSQRGLEVHLLTITEANELEDFLGENIYHHCLNKKRLRNAYVPIISHIRKIRPDFIFSTFMHINLLLLLLKPLLGRVKLIVRDANLPSLTTARLPLPKLVRILYGYLYPKSDTIICSSELMKNEVVQYIKGECHIKVIPNPVDIESLQKKALPISQKHVAGRCFIAVGRLHPQKGYDFLIDAMRQMSSNDKCFILGEGALRADLEKKIQKYSLSNRVELLGFQKNVAPFIARADAFLMPSLFEGMPNAALEALALGVPVIATQQSGGLIELENVTIASNHEAFIKAMRDCSRRYIKANEISPSLLPLSFTKENVVDQYETLLS